MPGEGRSRWVWWIIFSRRGASVYPDRGVPSWVNYRCVAPRVEAALRAPRTRSRAVISGFDIEDGSNYMFMPNKRGKSKLSTRRLNHEGGHEAYNKFVGAKLEEIYQQNNNPEQRLHKLRNLTKYLRIQIMNGCKEIPWK